jgi:helix-turn-helix protein
MCELYFTKEIYEQKNKVQEECRKLQVLLDKNIPKTSFIWTPDDDEVIMLPDLFKKEKRIREQNEDDEDEVEVKPKHSVLMVRKPLPES